MKIIYYEEQHLIPCAQLLMSHYNHEHFNCKFTQQRACAYLQELIFKPRFIGFLLLEKDKLIGFSFCHIRTWSDADDLYIDEFIIQDTYQKRGLGSKLLTFIYTYGSSLALAGITTTTNVISLTQFYQKNNFLAHDIAFLYKGCKKTDAESDQAFV
ncbi:MAG: GNAT family N-acetyltransferase [Defluviitaleaceae bacterium]|nr:GNAT family N-acetyltransferase [Defluviitaleaceae bacterium]